MQKKEFKKWTKLTKKILDDCREFRKLCDKPFDRGFIGELLVLKQLLDTYKTKLCANSDNKIIYAGSANKKWDFALKLNGEIIQINAKATTVLDKNHKPRWVRQQAKTFCDIKIERNLKQLVSLNADNDHHLFYVFVDVGIWLKNRPQQFFTLSDQKAKLIFGKKYFKLYNGQVRKSKSTDFWVEYENIKHFKDQRLRKL